MRQMMEPDASARLSAAEVRQHKCCVNVPIYMNDTAVATSTVSGGQDSVGGHRDSRDVAAPHSNHDVCIGTLAEEPIRAVGGGLVVPEEDYTERGHILGDQREGLSVGPERELQCEE